MVTQAEADKLKWFHSIDLGGGVVTKGAKSLSLLKEQADLAFSLGVQGKTVLDIGAWDGAFSFEAERRGASRVVASDHFMWERGRKVSFDFARTALRSNVETHVSTVEDLSPETVGKFDTVLFLGVLYHLRHPFLGLETAAALATDTLIVDTETALDTLDRPAMAFFPGSQLNNDPSNWWAPNVACAEAMLRDLGFKHIKVVNNPNAGIPKTLNAQRGRFFFLAKR